MSDKVKFVDYQESISTQVGKFLLLKGLGLASNGGVAMNSLYETSSLGILRKDLEAKPRKHLFGLVTREPRREFLGVVWFSNNADANEQNWVFEMYGRKYVEFVKYLAEEMASAFGVKITIHLVREQPDFETYESDYSEM